MTLAKIWVFFQVSCKCKARKRPLALHFNMSLGPRIDTISGLSLLLVCFLFKEVFPQVLRFPPLCENQHFQISIRSSTAKQSVFLRIQGRASSQTKGLEPGSKRRARLGRDRVRLALFAPERFLSYAKPILRKKPDCFAV